MKKLTVLAAFFLLNFGGIALAAPQTAALELTPTSLNVRDFGAKGDGMADDTQAIQRAVNAGISQYEKWGVRVRHWNHLANGITDSPHSEIVFPAGTYKISSPIVFRRYASLRGIGAAVIKQTDAGKDSFYFHGLLRATVENLQFEGGRIQLRFWTANNGTARIDVSRCTFSNSAIYAVECRSYTKGRLEGDDWNQSKPWSPYDLQWVDDVPQLTENNADHLKAWYNSTLVNITHCKFENAMHAADLSGDMVRVSDCEVLTNPQMEGAVFALGGKANLYRIKGLARLDATKHQYWIDRSTGGQFSLRECDFDTNAPQGICLVRAALLPTSTTVILENSRVKSAGSREGALLWIAKETEPNIVSINGMTETSGQPVKAVTWEQTPDAATLDKIKDQPKGAETDRIYKLQIAGNSSNIDETVPPIFKPLMLEAIPAAAIQETYIPELAWDYQELETQAQAAGKVLFASAFGVDQDPKTDDTASIQKAFEAAGKLQNPLVMFPAGAFTLSNTIQLPANVTIRAAGAATFLMGDGKKDIFSATAANAIAFKNCDFNGGRNGLDLKSDATQKARIAFDNCSFYDQEENGIRLLSGKGETGEANQTELRLDGGIFATLRAVKTNAARSQMSSFWAINDPRLDNGAFLQNLGGAMRVQDMLGNPTLWQGKRGKAPANIKDWQLSKNTCWIENWGRLYSLDNRFGGESGGMCNVVNHSTDGTIYIGGGQTRFYNGATRNAVLYLAKKPKLAILRDISSVPIRVEESWVVMNADGSDGRSTPGVIVRGVPAS
jgi:hypothetical protein